MRFFLLAACAAASLLTGCGRDPRPLPFDAAGPTFDPVAFFDGHIQSWGVMEGRSGRPDGWVVTDCDGHADGPDRLRMAQHLSFQGAPAQDRTWTLWRTGPHRFQATASDMVGSASGEADGRSFHWTWVLARAPGQRPFDVTMEQWMYRLDDGSVMIRTTVSKLGFILTEFSERFARIGDAPENTARAALAG